MTGVLFSLASGDIMQRATLVGAAAFFTGTLACAVPGHAQATVGADLALFSSYVWRGLSLTNKPVAQPDLYFTFPAGKASVTAGGWANIDLGKYDDPAKDLSESGGTSAFNFAEFDPWVEVGIPVGKVTLTPGATAYIYPNSAGFTSAFNTVELYLKAALDAPLSPKVSIYYDVDKVKGAYIEGGVSYSVPASKTVAINLGALAGFSAGQDANLDAAGIPQSEFFNFVDNGFTHLDLSAAVPLTAGPATISPALHLVINGDEATKVTSPTNTDKGAKLWGGVMISWSKALGPEPEATDEAKP
jgi:hypothetical protein